MSKSLYFIPIIEQVLKDPKASPCLAKAFDEIKHKGFQEPYAEGYRNFERFMDITYSHRQVVTGDHVLRLIIELAMETLGSTERERKLLLDVIGSHSEWKKEYEAFCREYASEDVSQYLNPIVQVSGSNKSIGELSFEKVPDRKSINDIMPGTYVLRLLNTGWTIWRGELTDRELIQTEAFGKADLRFAAGEDEGQLTGQKDLLNNGEVILRTFAGIESGSIEIELAR